MFKVWNKWRQARKARQQQNKWEQEQQDMAYRLLGLCKSMRVIGEKLDEADRINIASLLSDERYVSLLKLYKIYQENWTVQVFHKKVDEETERLYRGGVMMLQVLVNAVIQHMKYLQATEKEKTAEEKIMNMLGW